ncbi:transposase [Maribacter antarcticus]|uniref:transposase n=1 Tax=Maribacter antarcticus TaxID=505250 RepID=UPI00146FA2AE
MSSSIHQYKSHKVSLFLYHVVCVTKHRRFVLSPKVDRILKRACLDIEDSYDIHFLEIGYDLDYIHFLL